jgi:hypothetical protein
MEDLANLEKDQEVFEIDNYCHDQLSETRKWSMFLSILGFIFLGLVAVVSIGVFIFSLTGSRSILKAASLIPLLLVGIIYFFPIYYLFQFSFHSKNALAKKDNGSLAKAFLNLKMHYRFMGIMTIVVLVLYSIIIMVMLSTGSLLNFLHH